VVTVQAAGLVTGALADANTLAVLGMVSCGSRSPPTTAGRYLVSPFYDYGPLAMAFGNVGLCVVVYAVHGAAVWVYSTAQRVPWGAASAALRFPSIPRLLPVYLVQGAALGGSGLLWTGHVTASDIGFGLLALALVLPFAAVDAAVLRLLVSPEATFRPLSEVAGCDPPDAAKGCCLESSQCLEREWCSVTGANGYQQGLTIALLEHAVEACKEPASLSLCPEVLPDLSNAEELEISMPVSYSDVPVGTADASPVVALQETERQRCIFLAEERLRPQLEVLYDCVGLDCTAHEDVAPDVSQGCR
jgi:hypothetical protein